MGRKIGIKNPTINEYNNYIDLFKNISKELGRPIKHVELKNYNLPSSRWFVKHSNNYKVINYNAFIEYEIGMIPRYELSKESVINYILEIQNSLDRPLKKKDLKGINNNSIGEGVVTKYWGNFLNMKKELNLPLTNESIKIVDNSIFSIKRDIVKLCAYVLSSENRITIKQDDWNLLSDISSYQSCSKYLQHDNSSLRSFIESIGFNLIDAGEGYNHLYNDEELVKSQYEFFFSNYIRNKGFIFNKNYFRNVRYATFIKNSRCGYDCDYIINFNDNIIYIEIAGMLRDYKNNYFNNTPINNKTRENYRNKLSNKESMLKENNLNYYILFPSDLNDEYLDSIFK